MSKTENQVPLILSIIFATAAISGSLVFFAMQSTADSNTISQNTTIDDAYLEQKIEEGITNFIQKQQNQQQQAQVAQREAANEKAKNVPTVSNADHVYGNKDAEVTIIEYSDFDCPYCGRFHETAKKVVDESDGKINWVFRHFPLSFHDPSATQKAMASECVAELGGNDAFWEFADAMFLENVGADANSLGAIAQQIGVNRDAFVECLQSEKYLETVKTDLAEGAKAGVDGTPGNIIIHNESGKTRLLPGAQGASAVLQAVDLVSS